MLTVLVALVLAIVWPIVALFVVGGLRLWCARHLRFEASFDRYELLRKGDVVLVGKPSIWHDWYIQMPNVLTRRSKHRFWVHAAIYDGEGRVWEATREGVAPRPIEEYRDHLMRVFRHRYLRDPAAFDELIRFCEQQRDFGYGFDALVFFAISVVVPVSFNWLFDNPWIDRRLRLDRAYFCSELVVDAYASIGHPLSPYDGWRVKPSDFVGNPVLEPVWAHAAPAA